MHIDFHCPNGHKLKTSEAHRDRQVKCPKCGELTKVPPESPGLVNIDGVDREPLRIKPTASFASTNAPTADSSLTEEESSRDWEEGHVGDPGYKPSPVLVRLCSCDRYPAGRRCSPDLSD